MNFNPHYNLRDKHAFLGASNYHWVNYTDEKLRNVFLNDMARKRGTELHDLADRLIKLKVKLPRSSKTLNRYVNDAIGFNMNAEQILYYSDNCFGTADSISFKDNILRIHDLKTGSTTASLAQLRIYAALFCLEYFYNPNDISKIILRIYQNDDVIEEIAEPTDIMYIMDKIKKFDEIIEKIKMEG